MLAEDGIERDLVALLGLGVFAASLLSAAWPPGGAGRWCRSEKSWPPSYGIADENSPEALIAAQYAAQDQPAPARADAKDVA